MNNQNLFNKTGKLSLAVIKDKVLIKQIKNEFVQKLMAYQQIQSAVHLQNAKIFEVDKNKWAIKPCNILNKVFLVCILNDFQAFLSEIEEFEDVDIIIDFI